MDKEKKYITRDLILDANKFSYQTTLTKMVSNLTSMSKIYSNQIQSIKLSNFLQSQINLIDSLREYYSPILKTIQQLQDSFKPIYENMENILNSIPKVDLTPVISFYNNIKYFNFNISPEQEKEDIIEEISTATTEIIESPKITIRQKRNWFKKLLSILKTPLKYFIFSLILPTLFAIDLPTQKILYEARQEISQLNEEQKNNEKQLQYRYITHKARLYKNQKMKTKIDELEVGEIVIVLEEDREKIKVQILDTEEIGWILKKYSKIK